MNFVKYECLISGFTLKLNCGSCAVRVINFLFFQGDLILVFVDMRYVFIEVAVEHKVWVGAHDFMVPDILVVRKGRVA